MSSYAGENLFDSGPHSFRPGPWQRDVQRRSFAGVDGELILDLGRRSRLIIQAGRLQAPSAQALHALLEAIHSRCDGFPHTLVDNHGHSYPRALLEKLAPTTPLQRARGFYCDYEIEYRQLP